MLYDVCIIGSGAGAGPIAFELSKHGLQVVMLEKGEFLTKEDFSKDELAYCRRSVFTPPLDDEFHTIEEFINNKWTKYTTKDAKWDFWNGNIVGGASNFMSGFFHKLEPNDFKLKSTYGEIKGANIEDWCITYEEFVPYYKKVDSIIGVTNNTTEHPINQLLDQKAKELNLTSSLTKRAILKDARDDRDGCYYSNYCGSYGCSSGAKGSSREALINPALKTGNLTVLPNSFVKRLNTQNDEIVEAVVYDKATNLTKNIEAKIFVVACGSIESCRLLLNSTSKNYPNGIANSSLQVGKNLLFSGGGMVSGELDGSVLEKNQLFIDGLFVNRAIKDWYTIGGSKGGIVEFLFEHANPIKKAISLKYDKSGKLVWGEEFYKKLNARFTKTKRLDCEIFNDWLPNDDCFVEIDQEKQDKYGVNVAKIRIGSHPQNELIGDKIAKKTVAFLKHLGAKNIETNITPYPPQNLQAGGCWFGDNPNTSVLDKNCKAWDTKNLYVSDGSFMPTGGSVPYTYTIYANSFRVADAILKEFR